MLSYALAHNRIPVVNRLALTSTAAVGGATVRLSVRDPEGPIGSAVELTADLDEGRTTVLQDVALTLDTRPAAASDDVADTVHYGELAQALAAVVAGEPVDLLETLAARLADVCLADVRVDRARVTVHKPHAPIPLTFADVAVTIERGRGQA